MIDLPFWSTLMPSFEEAWQIAHHDQRTAILPLTSTEATDDGWLITRLPASGL
jgi:hypothetical protein